MNTDEYGEVINGFKTYETIVEKLRQDKSVIIGWTDEAYTHLDIMFTVKPYKEGTLQGGLRWTDLFVSIMGKCAWGFIPDEEKDEGYIAEKLRLGRNETTEKLTYLINGIIREANKK